MRASLLVVLLVAVLTSVFAALVPFVSSVVTTVVPVLPSHLTALLAPLPPFLTLFTGRFFRVLRARHHWQLPSLCSPR
jgi:hypothetical protein